MTLGEMIQMYRKNAALSQEELGEKLGVSRQSVSKWESDATIPELDKLIAMSKLFGVTVGELLGLEEPARQGSGLSEEDLTHVIGMVEKLTLADLEQKLPQGEPPRRKRRWPWVVGSVAIVVLVFTIVGLKNQMQNLQNQVSGLSYSVSNVQTNVGYQINSLTGQLTEILEKQNSVTADKVYSITSIDPKGETVTFALSATPRQYQEGMTAEFIAEGPDFETVTVPGSLEGQRFTANLICPFSDDITLSVAFHAGETTQNQQLEQIKELRTRSFPLVIGLHSSLWGDNVYAATGTYDRDDCVSHVMIDPGSLIWEDATRAVQLSTLTLLWWQDGVVVKELSVEIPAKDKSFNVSYSLHLTDLREGSRLRVVGLCTDEFGRTWETRLEEYEVKKDSSGRSAPGYRFEIVENSDF